MGVKKYLLFAGYGNRLKLKDIVVNKIRNLGLGMEVESLKFEVGKGTQFYFGIGVNLEDPMQKRLGTNLERLVTEIGLQPVSNRGSFFFDDEEIKGFLTDNCGYDSFLQPIKFEPADITGGEDLDFDYEGNQENTSVQGVDGVIMDKLLWWMSAKGDGSWRAFRDAASLVLDNDMKGTSIHWSLMRKLVVLGDVELDDQGRWGVTSTTIVKTTLAGSFLAGKVTPMLLTSLDGYSKSPSNGGPSRIGWDKYDYQGPILVSEDPALEISKVLPSVDAWKDGLRNDPDIEPHRYSLKMYDGRGFSERVEVPVRSGFYEVERLEGASRTKRVFFDGKRWISGGFYDLRWLAKKVTGQGMEVWLDGNGTLFIPESERWPLLYERPLVLSSGRLPVKKNVQAHGVLAYASVGKIVASTLAEKLGVKLKEV